MYVLTAIFCVAIKLPSRWVSNNRLLFGPEPLSLSREQAPSGFLMAAQGSGVGELELYIKQCAL